jgi:hypothetical protein
VRAKETWRSSRSRGCGPPTDIPEVGTAMGPHILMRGLPTSPNEPSGICSHGKGRGLRPLSEESDSSSASPVSTIASSAKRSVSVCREGGVGNVPNSDESGCLRASRPLRNAMPSR